MNQQTHNALEALGNGNLQAGVEVLQRMGARLDNARAKHPVFAEGKFQALGVIGGEYGELVQAVERESEERIRDELLDVVATCVRMLNDEYATPGA